MAVRRIAVRRSASAMATGRAGATARRASGAARGGAARGAFKPISAADLEGMALTEEDLQRWQLSETILARMGFCEPGEEQ
jgi:hypothetical protein